MMQTEEILRSVEGAFASELDLYRQLETLSVRQLDVLNQEHPDIDLVVEIMRSKNELVLRLSELERTNSPLKKQYEKIRETISEAQKQTLLDLRAQLNELLAKLLDMEKSGEERMKACGKEIENRLKQIQTTRKARHAYNAYARQATPPRFFDKRK